MTGNNKKRLAVVDDDADLREVLASYFQETYEVDLYPGRQRLWRPCAPGPPTACFWTWPCKASTATTCCG